MLWSRKSITSAWVQDEATAGRDSGRLVPVLIEDVKPPLGFRQYQAVNLTGFKGGGRSIRPLLDSLSAKDTTGPDERSIILLRERFRLAGGWKLPAVAVGLAAILFGAWLFLSAGAKSASPTVTVTAARGGDLPRAQELARSIAVDLGRYRAGPLGSLAILSADDEGASDAEYRVETGVSGSGSDLRAYVRLLSRKGSGPLWSAIVKNSTGQLVDLRQQVTAQLGDVLSCLMDVNTRRQKPTDEVLGLYLNGCAIESADETELSIFRQITAKAPGFAPGWANLALIESWIATDSQTAPLDKANLIAWANAHLKQAKALDPTLPEVFAAEANVVPSGRLKQGRELEILERGLALHPDSGILRGGRSQVLNELGRMDEAVEEAQKAVQLNPLSPAIRQYFIFALAYAGRTAEAFGQLKETELIWPGSAGARYARYHLNLRSGDPKEALRMLEAQGSGDLTTASMEQAWKAFLEARVNPSSANIERALSIFRDFYQRDPVNVGGYLQALGTFNRVDEAFQALASEEATTQVMKATDILFRAHMRSFRSDPRFISLANRLGLLTYWQTSRKWPDFCKEPGLPYDCRAEAAKLSQS